MPCIWAIGDLHLSFGTQNKDMDIFGSNWKDHHAKIASFWDKHVKEEDLVLLPGDISWAKKLLEAVPDFEWIAKRPGTKVMIRGNHDYWWESASKIRKILPESIHIISNDAFNWENCTIAGTRLWDSPEFSFHKFIEYKENPKMKETASKVEDDTHIFERELARLKLSLDAMKKDAEIKIVMTHYPPISAHLDDSKASKMFEEAQVNYVVFGHLHSLKKGSHMFGMKNNVSYNLVSCDWLDFSMLKIAEISK